MKNSEIVKFLNITLLDFGSFYGAGEGATYNFPPNTWKLPDY